MPGVTVSREHGRNSRTSQAGIHRESRQTSDTNAAREIRELEEIEPQQRAEPPAPTQATVVSFQTAAHMAASSHSNTISVTTANPTTSSSDVPLDPDSWLNDIELDEGWITASIDPNLVTHSIRLGMEEANKRGTRNCATDVDRLRTAVRSGICRLQQLNREVQAKSYVTPPLFTPHSILLPIEGRILREGGVTNITAYTSLIRDHYLHFAVYHDPSMICLELNDLPTNDQLSTLPNPLSSTDYQVLDDPSCPLLKISAAMARLGLR
jgi:hypothetical protein